MTKAPPHLTKLQAAFSQSIRQPFELSKDGYRHRVEGYEPLLIDQLKQLPLKSPIASIETYNEQYWFRLLNVMQSELPCLSQGMGLYQFNQLAMDYLVANPSAKPELQWLMERLENHIEQSPKWNSPERLDACRLDMIHQNLFYTQFERPLTAKELTPEVQESIIANPLPLQPAMRLYREEYNCVEIRRLALQNPEEEKARGFNMRRGLWMIYRGHDGIYEHPLLDMQFRLLKLLLNRYPIMTAFDLLIASDEEMNEITTSLEDWFKEWMELGWFSAKPNQWGI